ncbi:MAG: NfeD family protein [Negativicutes bacterium]
MHAVMWIAAAVLLIIMEMVGGGFYLACIAVGCLFGALASALFGSVALSIGIAAVIALIAMVFVRPLAKSHFLSGPADLTNIDAIIGKQVEVVEAITENGSGRVKQGGDVWPAADVDGKGHPLGAVLQIVGRHGGTVIVK